MLSRILWFLHVIHVAASETGRIPLELSTFNLIGEFTEIEFVSGWNRE
jgi:hypothetical protein